MSRMMPSIKVSTCCMQNRHPVQCRSKECPKTRSTDFFSEESDDAYKPRKNQMMLKSKTS